MEDKVKSENEKDFNPNPGPTFKEFLWNPESKEFLGRNAASWTKIIVFYIFFYIWLASFFGLCLYIFHCTLEDNAPKWKLSASLIGTNPGLGFRPIPDQNANSESTLIWYRKDDFDDRSFWTNQIEKFLNTSVSLDSDSLQNCEYGGNEATKENACKVDLTSEKFNNCSKENDYGYQKGEPCIILKLNKIYGWKPEGFGLNDKGEYDPKILQFDFEKQKGKGMPEWLIKYINESINGAHSNHAAAFLGTVWISCEGENPSDEETIGELEYLPLPGIPGYYFPYYNQKKGYPTPFVFLRMKKPYNNVLINIECKAWAKNIHPHRQTRVGSVHFELLID